MVLDPRLVSRMRNRVLGEMHLGHLRAGDRLPSVRDLSRELAADHRAVAAAYRALEAEGLVEMRGRTGVFAARQERLGGELVEETARWLAEVLSEARRRRIGVSDFPEFVRSCTARVRPRCVCVESNEDMRVAICAELDEEFNLASVPVHVDALPGAEHGRVDPAALPDEVRDADLLATTAFHAAAVRGIAEALGKPFALITVPEEMSGIIERRIRSDGLTVIVRDPAYGERFRAIYGGAEPNRIRVLLAGDTQAIARLDRTEPVLVTRAARRALPDLDLPLLLPRYPSISPDSTRELVSILIRLNLEAAP